MNLLFVLKKRASGATYELPTHDGDTDPPTYEDNPPVNPNPGKPFMKWWHGQLFIDGFGAKIENGEFIITDNNGYNFQIINGNLFYE